MGIRRITTKRGNIAIALAKTNEEVTTGHIGETTDAHDASAISNVPAGTISAVNVQQAIDELNSDAVSLETTVDANTVRSKSNGVLLWLSM